MKCPNCGCELRIVLSDAEEYDAKYFQYYRGICNKCGSLYKFYDVYEYTETSPLERIDPNSHQ